MNTVLPLIVSIWLQVAVNGRQLQDATDLLRDLNDKVSEIQIQNFHLLFACYLHTISSDRLVDWLQHSIRRLKRLEMGSHLIESLFDHEE